MRAEAADERQERVHGAFVGSDEHAAAPQVAQLAHGGLGFFAEAHQPLRVVAQHAARLGQRALLRRAVEEPLAELVLEPADGLADRGLGAVELGRRPRKAALGRDRQKHLQFGQFHGVLAPVSGRPSSDGSRHNASLLKRKKYRFD